MKVNHYQTDSALHIQLYYLRIQTPIFLKTTFQFHIFYKRYTSCINPSLMDHVNRDNIITPEQSAGSRNRLQEQ